MKQIIKNITFFNKMLIKKLINFLTQTADKPATFSTRLALMKSLRHHLHGLNFEVSTVSGANWPPSCPCRKWFGASVQHLVGQQTGR